MFFFWSFVKVWGGDSGGFNVVLEEFGGLLGYSGFLESFGAFLGFNVIQMNLENLGGLG